MSFTPNEKKKLLCCWAIDSKVMFGMHTLKNYVHLKQSVITVHALRDADVIVHYVWLIVSYLKYEVIVCTYS